MISAVNLADKNCASAKTPFVQVCFSHNFLEWQLDMDGLRGSIVSTLDAQTPADNEDLQAKLAALILV